MKFCKMVRVVAAWLVLCVVSVTAFAAAPAGYYDSCAGLSGQQLKDALYNIIKDHTVIPYSSGTQTDTHEALAVIDEDPNNSNNVLLHYAGTSVPKSTWPDWNREHTWPQSLGADQPPMESDLHHIFSEDMVINSSRGNSVFNVVTNPTNSSAGNRWTGTQFEPRDAVKGDVARALLYMTVRYPAFTLLDTDTPSYGQMGFRSVLLQWHVQDPPDAAEMLRNDKIYTLYQHNRNPFIDHPEYVNQIFGSTHDGDTLSVASTSRATSSVEAGTVDYPLLSLNLTASPTEFDVASIAVTKLGTIPGSGVTNLRLYADVDNNGAVSAGDSLLNTQTLSGDAATFSIATPYRVSGTTSHLLICATISSSQAAGATVGIRVNQNGVVSAASGGTDVNPTFANQDSALATITSVVVPPVGGTGLKIVKVSTRGSDGVASKEFVVLANHDASAVSLTGWTIKSRAGAGSIVNMNLSGTVPAHGHFLIASNTYGSSVEGVTPDFSDTNASGLWGGINDSNGRSIGLFNASGTEVDGFSINGGPNAPDTLCEGTAFTGVAGSSTVSFQRKRPGVTHGSYTDTDNNATDLENVTSKTPLNHLDLSCPVALSALELE